jgi:hypothetical protein
MKIKNREKLLQDIADGLRDLALNESIPIRTRPPASESTRNRVALGDIEVIFHVGGDSYNFDVPTALDNIVNDTFWDENGSWADADRAEVRVL